MCNNVYSTNYCVNEGVHKKPGQQLKHGSHNAPINGMPQGTPPPPSGDGGERARVGSNLSEHPIPGTEEMVKQPHLGAGNVRYVLRLSPLNQVGEHTKITVQTDDSQSAPPPEPTSWSNSPPPGKAKRSNSHMVSGGGGGGPRGLQLIGA